jgi:regulator of nonsense transcripts 3
VRRLAPGLTEEEFLSVLGEEWKVGEGKVDWFQYKAGKDSKEYSPLSICSYLY